ncbi:MAG: hypothetical protein CRU78_12510 [Candidatus Accumulibacter phosphatis]|uniref:Uncharacterized protein n=2 Tax=Candidatus Accumulibacter TaxID=327159 RepID=A0A6A7RWK1_9PROT|nr:hypothetical protein [Candidatus Accumulibacter phosphatis]RDE48879.1 MAG: hypothetical protein DVS81_19735 [Candidatus Accumulibacter meliphilus]
MRDDVDYLRRRYFDNKAVADLTVSDHARKRHVEAHAAHRQSAGLYPARVGGSAVQGTDRPARRHHPSEHGTQSTGLRAQATGRGTRRINGHRAGSSLLAYRHLGDHAGFHMTWNEASEIDAAGSVKFPDQAAALTRLEGDHVGLFVFHAGKLAHHFSVLLELGH